LLKSDPSPVYARQKKLIISFSYIPYFCEMRLRNNLLSLTNVCKTYILNKKADLGKLYFLKSLRWSILLRCRIAQVTLYKIILSLCFVSYPQTDNLKSMPLSGRFQCTTFIEYFMMIKLQKIIWVDNKRTLFWTSK
jgi:hypothetical protein